MTQSRIDRQGFFAFLFLVLFLNAAAQEFEFVVQHQGQSVATAVYGDYIYFNSGGNLHILKEGPDNSFNRINKIHFGPISGLNIDQNMLFVAAGSIRIYDLEQPEEPQLLGHTEFGSFRSAIVDGSLLIANALDVVVLYDVSDPASPVLLNSINFTFNGNGAYAYNEPVLYGFSQPAYSSAQYIIGYDISDPVDPELVTFIETSPTWVTPWADAMAVQEDRLLVGSDEMLRFYDVSDPDTIFFISEFTIPGKTGKIQWEGDLAWISARPPGLLLYDLSDVYNPMPLGIYESVGEIAGFHVEDKICGCGLGIKGFQVLDVSDHSGIEEVWKFDRTHGVYSVCLDQSIGYFGMRPSGLHVKDLSNIFEPIPLGSEPSLPMLTTIKKYGDYLYALDDGDSTLYVVDVSDPSQPQVTEEIRPDSGFISDFDVSGTSLFLIDQYTHLKKYYLFPPGLPSLVNIWNDTLSCLALDNNHLVMATPDSWPGGTEFSIELYTILENHDIVLNDKRLLGSTMTYRPRQMSIDYPYVYVRMHEGVMVYSISEEKLLVQCDEYLMNLGSTLAMTQNNDFIFLVTTAGTLVLKKTDPNNLELHQELPAPERSICAQDNLIFYAHGKNGYSIYGHDVTGINTNDAGGRESLLECYPNPADEKVIFHPFIPTGETGLLKIFDVYGRTVFVQEVSSEGEILIRINSFNQGIYFPVLEYANHRLTGKFIISR